MSITSTVNSLSSLYMVGKAAWNVYQILNRPPLKLPALQPMLIVLPTGGIMAAMKIK